MEGHKRTVANVLGNVGLWLLAHTCAAVVAGFLLILSMGITEGIDPMFDATILETLSSLERWSDLPGTVLLAGVYALPFALIVSGIPEALGRKPRVFVYAFAGAIAGVTGLLFIMLGTGFVTSVTDTVTLLSTELLLLYLLAGLAGGVAMVKLRAGFLRPR